MKPKFDKLLGCLREDDVQAAIDNMTDNLATVATTGDYDDLINKPQIPTVPDNISAFINDVGYLTQHQDISGKTDSRTQEPENNLAIWDGLGQFKEGVSLLRILQDVVNSNIADLQDIIASLTPPPTTGWVRLMATERAEDIEGECIIAEPATAFMAVGDLVNYRIECRQATIQNNRIDDEDVELAKKYTIEWIGNAEESAGGFQGMPYYTISYKKTNNETRYLAYSASGLSNTTAVNTNSTWFIYVHNGTAEFVNRGKSSIVLKTDVSDSGKIIEQSSQAVHTLAIYKEVSLNNEVD